MSTPSKFTPELRQRFLGALAATVSISTASAACGIHRDTFYAWQHTAAKEPDGEHAAFMADVAQTIANAEVRAASELKRSKDWRAHAHWLERRFESWRQKQDLDVRLSDHPGAQRFVQDVFERFELVLTTHFGIDRAVALIAEVVEMGATRGSSEPRERTLLHAEASQ